MPGPDLSRVRPSGDYARTLDGELWDVLPPISAEPLTLRRRTGDPVERVLPRHELGPVERVSTYAVWRGQTVRVDAVADGVATVSTGNPRVVAVTPGWVGNDHDGWTAQAPLAELGGLREAVTWVTRGWPVADPPADAVSGIHTEHGVTARRTVTATWRGETVGVDRRRDDGAALVSYQRSTERAAELGMQGNQRDGWWRWVPADELTDVRMREQDPGDPALRPGGAPR